MPQHKPRALCLIRPDPHYRRDAFHFGLLEAGFQVVERIPDPRPEDALVLWNRMGRAHELAASFEKADAAVMVAENGYIGCDDDGKQLYALALNHHNGAGRWHVGEPGRWRSQHIELKPWRTKGEEVLLLPQRGIGEPGVAMPPDWTVRTLERLKKLTERPIRIRQHPGRHEPERSLEEDLANAWCAVVWGSGAGIKAIAAGVPVFTDFPRWIGAWAASCFGVQRASGLEEPLRDDDCRIPMFDRLAWAQWSVAELTTGLPFKQLMELHRALHG